MAKKERAKEKRRARRGGSQAGPRREAKEALDAAYLYTEHFAPHTVIKWSSILPLMY